MRDEETKYIFNKFSYYYNDNDPNDKFNCKDKKFNNPHINLKLNSTKTTFNNVNYNSSSSISNKEKLIQTRNSLYNNQKKFSKMKISSANTSNSNSTQSLNLNKHYRHVSSNNSTSNSTNVSNPNQVVNQLKGKRTHSLLNFKY